MASQPNARVLEDILKTLQRLETSLEGRTNPLGTIETRTVSVSTHDTSRWRSGSSRAPSNSSSSSRLPGQEHEPGSPITPPCSYDAQSAVDSYKASIAELRRRFEFIDDQDSLRYSGTGDTTHDDATSTHAQPAVGPGLHGDEHMQRAVSDDDPGNDHHDIAYTESMYSQFPSRLDLGNSYNAGEEVPPLPDRAQLRNYYLAGRSSSLAEGKQQESTPPDQGQSWHGLPPDGPSQVHPGTVTHAEDRASRPEPSAYPSPNINNNMKPEWKSVMPQRHDRVAMAYFAWDRFNASLLSSWWPPTSPDREANKSERRRLRDAGLSHDPDRNTWAVPELETEGSFIVARLTTGIARRFRFRLGKMQAWLRGSVDMVA